MQDQKSGPVIKITDSRRNATPILRITDHSVRNASRNPAGVTDKIRLLDDERGDMSSDSDNDMTPMVSPVSGVIACTFYWLCVFAGIFCSYVLRIVRGCFQMCTV